MKIYVLFCSCQYLMLWVSQQGKSRVGHLASTYINQLCRDAACLPEDLQTLMQEWDGAGKWRCHHREVDPETTTHSLMKTYEAW